MHILSDDFNDDCYVRKYLWVLLLYTLETQIDGVRIQRIGSEMESIDVRSILKRTEGHGSELSDGSGVDAFEQEYLSALKGEKDTSVVN